LDKSHDEEINVIEKNKTWELTDNQQTKNKYEYSGCTRQNTKSLVSVVRLIALSKVGEMFDVFCSLYVFYFIFDNMTRVSSITL
jgi:hypothetical protein